MNRPILLMFRLRNCLLPESYSADSVKVKFSDGKYEITIYTSCCNANRGIYYYTTYDNHQICAVDMHCENLDGSELSRYALLKKERIFYQN